MVASRNEKFHHETNRGFQSKWSAVRADLKQSLKNNSRILGRIGCRAGRAEYNMEGKCAQKENHEGKYEFQTVCATGWANAKQELEKTGKI